MVGQRGGEGDGERAPFIDPPKKKKKKDNKTTQLKKE